MVNSQSSSCSQASVFQISPIKSVALSESIPCIWSCRSGIHLRVACVTASKDGAVRLWDGVTANCVRSIVSAHGTAEATSANFTKDQRYASWTGSESSCKMNVCRWMHV